jgi:hypothetical protein
MFARVVFRFLSDVEMRYGAMITHHACPNFTASAAFVLYLNCVFHRRAKENEYYFAGCALMNFVRDGMSMCDSGFMPFSLSHVGHQSHSPGK